MLRLTLLLALTLLILPGSGLAGVGETSIFYYPWYGTPARDGSYEHWAQNGHQPPGDLASSYYPARGPYSSSDPSVVQAQMREIAGMGIREVVSSWWGWGSPEDLRLPLLMEAAARAHLEVAVQIEPYELWQRSEDVLAADLQHLHDLGIGRAYVFRPFDGMIDDAGWTRLNDGAADLQIQMWAQTGNVARAAADGFDGVYTYDIVDYGPGSFARICARAHATGLLCAPSVGPGYDALRARGDTRIIPRQNGAFYDAMWRAAVNVEPDRVTITSYNEWHEGTQIEPAKSPPPRVLSSGSATVPYASYSGAWGRTGRAAERAYLVRTSFWTRLYRALALTRRLLTAL